MKNNKKLPSTKSIKRDNLSKSPSKNFTEGVGIWASFYRANPHRFIMDYLGFELHLFQQILIYVMDKVDTFCFIASRGLGKSWLTAVYCCCRSILYPGSNIILAAKVRKQAQLIITEKIIGDLYKKSEALRREIKEWKIGANESYVEFWNGSKIMATVSNDNARGLRGNMLIIDEYRLVDEAVVNDILIPTLTAPRQPGFLRKPEYKHLIEESKEIYLSSGWYKHHWSYKRFKEIALNMLKGKDAFACSIPFTCSLDHGLLTKKRIKKEMEKESMTEASFQMEYCGKFWGEKDASYFKMIEIEQCRTIENPFYPPTDLEYVTQKSKGKKVKSSLPKKNGEIRILSADIAVSNAKGSDNSAYVLMRILPNGGEWTRQVCYIETHNGMEAERQAIRLKQLFYDFECDKMIIDTQGIGKTVWGYLQKVNVDTARGEEYESFTCYNEDKSVDKMASRGSIPVVYSLIPSRDSNHDCARLLKDAFVQCKIKLPVSDWRAKEVLLEDDSKFLLKSPEEQARLLYPFLQTNATINETINLEFSLPGGKITLSEVGSATKDRYSSLSYVNYLAEMIEKEEVKRSTRNSEQIFAFW